LVEEIGGPGEKRWFVKSIYLYKLVRKDMAVNKHKRLSNITLRHKCK